MGCVCFTPIRLGFSLRDIEVGKARVRRMGKWVFGIGSTK